MIYLIDIGFRIKRALDILVNQVKCPDGYKKCQCLDCKAKGKLEVNDNGNDNENDNDIDIDNGNGNGNCNQGTCLASHEQSSFSDGKQETHNDDDDKYTSTFSERTPSVARQRGEVLGLPTKQRDKPFSQCGCGCGCGGAPSLNVSRLDTPVNGKGNFLIDVDGRL